MAERKFFLPWHLKGYHQAGEEVEVRSARARVQTRRTANMASHQSTSVEKMQSFSCRRCEAIRIVSGLSLYKTRQPYYKFFVWLDEYVAGLGLTKTKYMGEKKIVYVEDYHRQQDMEMRISCLEKRILALEMKRKPIRWYICVIVIVLIFAVLSCKS